MAVLVHVAWAISNNAVLSCFEDLIRCTSNIEMCYYDASPGIYIIRKGGLYGDLWASL